jgi:hypothetical protein
MNQEFDLPDNFDFSSALGESDFNAKRQGRPMTVFKISVEALTSEPNKKIYEKIKNLQIRKTLVKELDPAQIKKKFLKLKPEEINPQALAALAFEKKETIQTVRQICDSKEEYVNIPLADIKKHFIDPMEEVINFFYRK